ncbi:MAG: sigma-70 family RNA polymerase sigma factor [Firmicutes bacterium]|nr:sigma-70 family RNA polymerase sigma factor [Bacillota bacterium]
MTTAMTEAISPARTALSASDEFEKLVRAYEKPLYQFAYRLCGDHHEAQDLLQEGLYRAYKSFAKFETGTAFDRWLYQIIHNLYIDHYRKKKNRPVVASIDEPVSYLENEKPVEIPDWTTNPEDEAVRGELGLKIETGLKRLPAEYRTAVILCDIQGLSYDEISQILRCSIGTVRSRIHRGRKMLRRILLPYLQGKEVEHS